MAIVTVLTPQSALAFEDAMVDFAETMDTAWRCNQSAVTRGRVDLTRPTRAAVQAYILNPDSTVVLVTNDAGTVAHGYLIARDDRTPPHNRHGGCQVKWIGVRPDLTLAQKRNVFVAMLDVAATTYDWCWGRVSNPMIYDLMLRNMVDVAEAPWGPESLTYRRLA